MLREQPSRTFAGAEESEEWMETISYDRDYYAWAKHNAELIRQGKFTQIDAENIAEELESMGKSQRRELTSRLTVLLTHLLKWQFQAEKRTNSWASTIITQRAEIRYLLADSPSLKAELDAAIQTAYSVARDRAEVETGISSTLFPETCPYTFDQIMAKDFWPA